jgi:DNA-directed RNA polymerase subunit RPC12/RpoP
MYSNQHDARDYERHIGDVPEKREKADRREAEPSRSTHYLSVFCPEGWYVPDRLEKATNMHKCPYCRNRAEEKLFEWISNSYTMEDAIMIEYYCTHCKKEFAEVYEQLGTLRETGGIK